MKERDLQQQVLALAQLRGWRAYHTYDSRRSQAGFPDLVLVRQPRVVFAELKSERGRISPEQRGWLEELQQCAGVETHLWRPDDWAAIDAALL